MGGLSNAYVEELLYTVINDPNKFKGVLACDLFLEFIKKNHHLFKAGDCFVINMSSTNHSGSHFVCLMINSKCKAEYFDSYGLPSIDTNINTALNIANLKTSTFQQQIQNLTSQFCGIYCGKSFFRNNVQYNILHF